VLFDFESVRILIGLYIGPFAASWQARYIGYVQTNSLVLFFPAGCQCRGIFKTGIRFLYGIKASVVDNSEIVIIVGYTHSPLAQFCLISFPKKKKN
jgi:hypothetical protein